MIFQVAVSGTVKLSAYIFNMRGCILSGPGDLLMLRLVNCLKTTLSVMFRVVMEVWHFMPISGILEGFSTVSTL